MICFVFLLIMTATSAFAFSFPIACGRPQIRQACSSSSSSEEPEPAGATSRRIIDGLVQERMQCRLERDYFSADRILSTLKLEHNVEVTDYPYKSGGRSTWRYLDFSILESERNNNDSDSEQKEMIINDEKSLMWIARNAYTAMRARNRTEREIVDSSVRLLRLADYDKFMDSGYVKEMQGRKFADAAFYFSLAGVGSDDLYRLLLIGATAEIGRYGRRKSCRPIDILHVVERLAVAGILDQEVYSLAAEVLQLKIDATAGSEGAVHDSFSNAIARLSSGSFSLFSDMPLMWLWRFSARQRKHGNQVSRSQDDDELENSQQTENLDAQNSNISLRLPRFDDPTLPLVVDIGCGFGVSMLGLSHRQHHFNAGAGEIDSKQTISNYRKRNYIACDMSHRAVSYARGIAGRWGLQGSCRFVESDAASFLDLIMEEYEGQVECILINFPTPYQFGADTNLGIDSDLDKNIDTEIDVDTDDGSSRFQGNSQLPTDMTEFMVTPSVIEKCRKLLGKPSTDPVGLTVDPVNSSNRISGDGGMGGNSWSADEGHLWKYLLIQTNVEDVAVTMKNIVCDSDHFDEEGGLFIPDCSLVLDQIKSSWNQDLMVASDSDTDRAVVGDSAKNAATSTAVASVEGNGLLEAVEDTAVVREEAEALDGVGDLDLADSEGAEEATVLQRRAVKWISSGGERAEGSGWLRESPLPRAGRTETEAMCAMSKKPVHRMLFAMRPHPLL